MSVAYLAVALSALASAALQDPTANAPGSASVEPANLGAQPKPVHKASTLHLHHELAVRVEPRPVRFRSEQPPILKLAAAEYVKTEPRRLSASLIALPAPKSGIRTYGAITNLSENVQALVDYYDEMVWRPVSMDGGGGGVQYRMKFGAKPLH
jgi:hypothetical protein